MGYINTLKLTLNFRGKFQINKMKIPMKMMKTRNKKEQMK